MGGGLVATCCSHWERRALRLYPRGSVGTSVGATWPVQERASPTVPSGLLPQGRRCASRFFPSPIVGSPRRSTRKEAPGSRETHAELTAWDRVIDRSYGLVLASCLAKSGISSPRLDVSTGPGSPVRP